MRVDKMTQPFQQALMEAQSLAVGRDSPEIQPAHLMLALLDQKDTAASSILRTAGTDVQRLRRDLREHIEALPRLTGERGQVSASSALQRLLNIKLAQGSGRSIHLFGVVSVGRPTGSR